MKVIIYLFVNWVRIHAHVSYWNGVVRWNAYIFWNVAHWSSDAFISILNTIFHAQFCFCFFQTKKKNGILWQNNKLNTNGCASIAVARTAREYCHKEENVQRSRRRAHQMKLRCLWIYYHQKPIQKSRVASGASKTVSPLCFGGSLAIGFASINKWSKILFFISSHIEK